jgi:hypothetical protein
MEHIQDTQETNHPEKNYGPNAYDYVFLGFLVVVVVLVTWLGIKNYDEAVKTERAKSNGEAWATWLTETGLERGNKDFKLNGCRSGVKPDEEQKVGTWGSCLEDIMTQSPLKDQINPFLKKQPKLIPQCISTDRTVIGDIVLEKMVATPPGSAVPVVISQLTEADSIQDKMQIRISVCDKGGYPIQVSELEF